jgi:hypothetical protein
MPGGHGITVQGNHQLTSATKICHKVTWRNRLSDHLIGAGAKLKASQPTHGFTGKPAKCWPWRRPKG